MSTTRGAAVIAERYARALLEVALERELDADAIATELDSFVGVLADNEDLARVLSTTSVPAAKRLRVLDAVLAKTDFGDTTRNTLRLLTNKERMGICDVVAAQYRRALDEHNKVASGEVVSAQRLSDAQKQDLARRLGEVTGKQMQLTYQEDPDIVGGLIIGVGEKVAEVYWGPLVNGAIENWFAYVLAMVFLFFRPQGLFGERIIERV